MENFWSFYSKQIMDTEKAVDLSSCLLVEASGDSSEVDFDPEDQPVAAPDYDNDDAESCSCDVSDSSYYRSCVSDNLDGSEFGEANSVVNNNNNNKENDQELEDEVHKYQTWADHDEHFNGLQVNHQKSCVSIESTNEPMNEMERNRLFWETCLAS